MERRNRGMRRLPLALVALFVALPAAGAGAARADNPVLTGDVGSGDSFTINLAGPDGTRVKNLDPGTYTLVVHDHSSIHNFDLTGPGVSVSTDVDAIEDKTFTITLTAGTYTYVCDAHVSTMKGTFTVGSPTATPPPAPIPTPTPTPKPAATKLLASVGPGAKISLRSIDGSALSSLPAGLFIIVVTDRSAKDNFHLSGPGISKATGVAFKGTATWRVSLKAGKYVFRSDKHAALHGGFALSA
jgi:plastocyanin